MSDTPLLALPYLAASQAQKHVTHNEALSVIDGLIFLSVISRALSAPPATPMDGDRYLIAASPTSAWLGHAAQITLRMEGAWRFLIPRKGWSMWVESESAFLVFDGINWVGPPPPSTLQNMTLLGVNATADATNKLAVSSSSVLFNNAGAGVQLKTNKATATDTASLLFQTAFSGRAEIGTAGDDNLHFKVSATGSSFNESLIINAASGLVTIKNNASLDPQAVDPTTPVNGQLWYNSTSGKFRARQNGANIDLVATASGVADGDKGDITVSASGAVWTIDAATITNAKLVTMAAFTLKGNNTAAAATPIDLTAAQVKTLLAIANTDVTGLGTLAAQNGTFSGSHAGVSSGTNTGDQTIALTGDVTGSGTAAFAVSIAANAVTNAKLAAMPAFTFKANSTLAAAAPQDLTADQMLVALNIHGQIQARSLSFF
jgi:Protein of unknown function (DUF2793)